MNFQAHTIDTAPVASRPALETISPSGAMRAIAEALQWLDMAVEHGSYKINYVAFWPHLDDPRFQGLVERVYRQRMPKIPRSDN